MILTRKRCTPEINVIWYAFSLVFVIFWCLETAMWLGLLDGLKPLWIDPSNPQLPAPVPPYPPSGQMPQRAEPDPWTIRWLFEGAQHLLIDIKGELALVLAVVITAIVPQLLTYILSGLCGCASTPKLVWQFEKFVIWSLIKFLAALAGFLAAAVLNLGNVFNTVQSIYTGTFFPFWAAIFHVDINTFLKVLSAIGGAFTLAVLQNYFLDFADALSHPETQKQNS